MSRDPARVRNRWANDRNLPHDSTPSWLKNLRPLYAYDIANDENVASGEEELRVLIKRVTKDGTNEQLNALRILGGCNRYFDFVGVAFPGEDGTEQNRRWHAFRTSLNKKLKKAGWQLERDVNDVGYVKNAILGEVRNK